MRSKQSGFTLIEALIAFVVLSVGIVGTLLFHANLLADSNDNKSKLEAMAIAEKWMEVNRSQQPSTAAAMQTYISTLNE